MGKIMVKTTGKGVFIRMSNPGNFGSKTLNVILLFSQHILGNEQRERAVLDSHLLDMRVEPLLDLLPNAVRSGLVVRNQHPVKQHSSGKIRRISYLENKASRHIVVVQHVTLGKNLLIPSWEILLLGHIDTNQGGTIALLCLRLGCGLFGLRLPNTLVHGLIGLVRSLFGQLGRLLRSVLGLSLGSVISGGLVGAIRKGLRGGRVRGDGVFLTGHCA